MLLWMSIRRVLSENRYQRVHLHGSPKEGQTRGANGPSGMSATNSESKDHRRWLGTGKLPSNPEVFHGNRGRLQSPHSFLR